VTTASCKAKGRALQQVVRNELRRVGAQFGLVDEDILSQTMGISGVDIVLSPAAKAVMLDPSIECKNVENLAVTTVFLKHQDKYKDKMNLLIHKRNHTPPLATMRFDVFMELYETFLKAHHNG
jgi:hypothetical protein